MKTLKILLCSMFVCVLFASVVQANSLCQGKEGLWISQPAQDSNFGNYHLGGMCDDNSCYHITISNDAKGEDMVGLAFTCEEIGDGTDQILWVFVDVQTGEKQEVHANLQQINEILRQTLND